MRDKEPQKLLSKPQAKSPARPPAAANKKKPVVNPKNQQKNRPKQNEKKPLNNSNAANNNGTAKPNEKNNNNKPNTNKKKRYGQKNYNSKPKNKNYNNSKPPVEEPQVVGGAKNIVTKRPVWEQESKAANPNVTNKTKPVQNKDNSVRKSYDREKRLNSSISKALQRNQIAELPKEDDKGLFDFSEDELREDTGIKVINRSAQSEVKYANFSEYLQKTQGDK